MAQTFQTSKKTMGKVIELFQVYNADSEHIPYFKQFKTSNLVCIICMMHRSKHHCTKMKFSIKEFFSKCDQIYSSLRIRLHLLKKSLMNFIFVQKCTELHKCTEVL